MRKALLIIGVATACSAIVLFTRPSEEVQVQSAQPAAAATESVVTHAHLALAENTQRHDVLLAAAIDDLPRSTAAAVAGGMSPAVDDWPRSYKRTSFSIARYFLTRAGKATADMLVRHEVLNRDDTPIPENAVDLLRVLVSKFNTTVGPLVQNHRHMRTREMVSQIEARLVVPDELAMQTESERRMIAGIRAAEFGTTVEHELAKMAPAEPSRLIPYNHIRHQGRVYAQSKFKALPRSDTAFADIHAVAAEYCFVVLEWFDARGYLKAGAFDTVLNDFAAATPLKSRSVSVQRKR